MRGLDRALPGHATKKKSKPELTKQRSNYFEDAFAVKEQVHPAKERVISESIVMADVKTNVIVSAMFCPTTW